VITVKKNLSVINQRIQLLNTIFVVRNVIIRGLKKTNAVEITQTLGRLSIIKVACFVETLLQPISVVKNIVQKNAPIGLEKKR
jgi:hypothetical protein